MTSLTVNPIGYYHSEAKYPYDVARQGTVADCSGFIELLPDQNFEMALDALDGFSLVWVIFWFHHNDNWHPKVRPPRHLDTKVGVFATRSPHRPNPIGLSAVRLTKINGLKLFIDDCDLLDGTPIIDIKPYLPFADAFPNAKAGWTEKNPAQQFHIQFSDIATRKILWLTAHGVPRIKQFICDRLEFEPDNRRRHRLISNDDDCLCLAYRTWRIKFQIIPMSQEIIIKDIFSGYSENDFSGPDKYNDFSIHQSFNTTFLESF